MQCNGKSRPTRQDNRSATSKLREEVREEIEEVKDRLTAAEKFNTRVLAYATVAVTIGAPVLLAIVKWGVPALLTLL